MKKYALLLLVLVLYSCNNDDDSMTAAPVSEVISEFRTNLSELNLYTGTLNELNVSSNAFIYDLNTPLFTDYSNKQRFIALPQNTSMQYNGDGLPIFPENTVIAKTFYYNLDDRNLSLGKKIIETRLLIKLNGTWQSGNYKWNEDQTDAIFDQAPSSVPVTWIDIEGSTNTINYKIPSNNQCGTCHGFDDQKNPIGPKLRTLNFDYNGENQLQTLINNQYLEGLQNASNVRVLPNWKDDFNFSLEERARAYIDINCAHCHSEGGYCEVQSPLRLNYETSLLDSNIQSQKNSIIFRVSSDFQPGLTMPWIGTSILHDEGVGLMLEYLNTLQ
ncbi:hypothetical protein [uncultured Winogradskyella sp.]|uniref:hypothetical protein n=1 Tax=uncultured Winogradskyella sp. TaxID=395353 RepID=UPI0030DB97C7|tara:strand:- start:179514 stop:180503 length:990 start_codon:yes stop_codon:yes gene_type:complete